MKFALNVFSHSVASVIGVGIGVISGLYLAASNEVLHPDKTSERMAKFTEKVQKEET